MANFHVIIVGAGLAGPLLANGLLASGVSVAVYEKLGTEIKRDGYQMRIAQPSFKSFEMLLDAEKYDKIRGKMGHFSENQRTTPHWYDSKFNFIFDFGRLNNEYHGSAPMDRVVLRNVLMEEPLKHNVVHFAKGFNRYEILNFNQANEKVRVWFDDGSSSDCDLLIGADGSRSKVNQTIGLNNIHDVPVFNFITKVDLPIATLRNLPVAAQRAPIVVFSHRKTFFCVAYLPKHEDTSKAYDEGAASFTFSMVLPIEECPEQIQAWKPKEQWKFLSDSIREWDPVYSDIIDVIQGEPLHIFQPRASARPAINWRTKIHDINKPELGHPRVWVLGDAMHVMLPNRGMGGNQAMLDTTFVLPLLEKLNKIAETTGSVSKTDITLACESYEKEMIPRTFRWVEESGGFKPVPFDTNVISGKLLAISIRWLANIRDSWNYLFNRLTFSKRKAA